MVVGDAPVRAFERGVDATVDDAFASFDDAPAAGDARIADPVHVARRLAGSGVRGVRVALR